MIEALTLRGLEDGILAEIMIEALSLRRLDDGIRAEITISVAQLFHSLAALLTHQ